MSKILKLNSYSLYDELGDRDYMVYEVKYDDGHKEYVSRDMFRNLKALEIIKTKEIDIRLFNDCPSLDEYNNWASDESQLTKEEYDLLKEVLLCKK